MMTDDQMFRWLFLLVVLITAPCGLYFRIRANSGEKLDRWQEGPFILFGLRLSAALGSLGGLAWLVNPEWLAWSSVALPVGVRWVGVGWVLAASMLLVWTFWNLGANLTDTVVTRKDHSLVTSGPYRFVRHPFYLAFALGALGWSLLAANWYFLLAGSISSSFLLMRTSIEEAKLLERFGDEYRVYMASTGRFLPRLWRARH